MSVPERANREGDTQPLPRATDGPIMHEIVIEALRERLEVGIRRYGQPLQAFNGRDPAQDAFEEVLDLSVYLAQARIEMQAFRDFVGLTISLLSQFDLPDPDAGVTLEHCVADVLRAAHELA